MFVIYNYIYLSYVFQQLHVYFAMESVCCAPHTANPEVSLTDFYKERKVTATLKPTAH